MHQKQLGEYVSDRKRGENDDEELVSNAYNKQTNNKQAKREYLCVWMWKVVGEGLFKERQLKKDDEAILWKENNDSRKRSDEKMDQTKDSIFQNDERTCSSMILVVQGRLKKKALYPRIGKPAPKRLSLF